MNGTAGRTYQNRLLMELPPGDLERLRGGLRPVELHRGDVLTISGDPPEHIYFIEHGVVVVQGEAGPAVDLIGRSGVVGLDALFVPGSGAAGRATVLVSGQAHRLAGEALRASGSRLPVLNAILMLAMQCRVLRLTQSAVCHARHALEARSARWLLMLRDELESDELPVTHEFLAEALGVRRAGVTGAMVTFQQEGLLRQGRARVRITDAAGLQRSACPCYAKLLTAQAAVWAAHNQPSGEPAAMTATSFRAGEAIRTSLKQRIEARANQPGVAGRFGPATQVCRDVIRQCEAVLSRA